MVKAIPDGFQSVTPIVVLRDPRAAIDFYVKAFGAREDLTMPGPDGKSIMHAQITIGNAIVMMGGECEQSGTRSAQTMGGSPVSFYIYLEDVDQAFQKAVAAGATPVMDVMEMFWGDRVGTVKDPFGHTWMLATHTRDLTPEQMAEGAQASFAQMGKK